METIAIKVDAQIAKAYEKITPMKRQQIDNLVNNLLKDMIEKRSSDEIIKDMQQQAKNLTPATFINLTFNKVK